MRLFHLIIVSLFLIIDRLTKYFFQNSHFSFASRLLTLRVSQNQRLFFLQIDQSFLIVLSLISIGVLIFFLIKNKDRGNFLLTGGLLLIILGGSSNLFDRIFSGYVIDFIRVFFLPFFTFNISDVMITAGCLLIAIYYLPTAGIRRKE